MPHQQQSDQLLLIAARSPISGQTKTRLGATIGMDRAAQLYEAFLHDLAGRFVGSPLPCDLVWAHTPESAPFDQVLVRIRPDLDLTAVNYVQQVGDDWAERQANLLRWGAEQGYSRTVLTASDSPHMSRAMVTDAFAALADAEVVIGHVHDGGYYLVGVQGFHDVVSGVPMGTSSAAEGLVNRARMMGLRVATVEPTFDVDVEADLALLVKQCRDDSASAPATAIALAELGLDGHAERTADANI